MEKSDSSENEMNGFRLEFNDATGILTLHELAIKNKEVIEYIRNLPETKQEEIINEILEFGVKSLKSFLTENYGKVIDEHFKNGFSEFDREISQRIGEIDKKVFQAFIDKAREKVLDDFATKFDEKKESLMKVMRESNQKLDKEVLQSFAEDLKDKVFASFKTDFSKIAEDLKVNLKQYVVEQEISVKTPAKGKDFEDYIVRLTELIAKPFGDAIVHIGADNQTGDVMVENSSDKLRFCIEAKDRTLTNPEIKETFEEMEKVRKVQHSIIVFRNSKEVPKSVDAFHLLGKNRLVLTVAEKPDEDPNPFLFNVGYRIMRFLTLSEKPSTKEFDIVDVTKHVKNIEITLKTVASLKAKVTSFSTDLKADLDELKRDIEGELKEIEGVLEE